MNKRTLTQFDVMSGYDNDDFAQDMRTIIITYNFRGQKKRRRYAIKVSMSLFRDMKTCRSLVWNRFKKIFNIVG